MVTYCTATDVANYLQIDEFTSSTNVTKTQVEDLIEGNEDYIDEYTQNSWRESTRSDEYKDLDNYITASMYGERWIKVHLDKHKIFSLDSDKGDKIEIWDGDDWVDYLTSDSKEKGRNKDFWINNKEGILYIRAFIVPRVDAVRLTYRYGESSVPKDIRKACTLLTARDVVLNEDTSNLIPEGSEQVSLNDKVDKWEKEAREILSRKQAPRVITK